MIDFSALSGGNGVGGSQGAGRGKSEMGQEDFLKLMTAQLRNQDPMEPMQSGEFMTQIAQFTSANGIGELSKAFSEFTADMKSDQALRAASLVGREVSIRSPEGYLAEGGELRAGIQLPSRVDNLTVKIRNAAGQLVHERNLGGQPAGQTAFSWDGTDAEGNSLPPGRYQISASTVYEGESYALETVSSAQVQSVRLGQGGQSPTLTLAGLGETSLDSVQQIQ
ncbi:flagellar hook assembly protein FlgD [Alkalilimnicola sp. S0819]|uniref:flagellar hook assembly protein FlgD n=1 Tax=Alkalilimnicola sp. S0819 TaxID=2613922 RepID=UPI001262168C|nr:flagellar hook assembly protein FlgD [Alkalilimnicola sp. S0819]KAB7627199.1 flagellar hook assembly protein FlgD [Alkalilimnicola sp. S0819]MPQ15912.1 flagellar hook assembly protein FlgD [Alkalilimnicola sp. S0819]